VSLSCLELRQCSEPLLPSVCERIPLEAQRFQPLPAFNRHTVSLFTLGSNPLTEPVSPFEMNGGNLTVAFSCYVSLKQTEPFVPRCTNHINTCRGNGNA